MATQALNKEHLELFLRNQCEKVDLELICLDLEVPSSGTKAKLVERILGGLQKEEKIPVLNKVLSKVLDLCADVTLAPKCKGLGLPSDGSKEELAKRLHGYIFQ